MEAPNKLAGLEQGQLDVLGVYKITHALFASY